MPTVSLEVENLFQLHPNAILVDKSLNVISIGGIAQKYSPSLERGRHLAEYFEISPVLTPRNACDFAAQRTALMLFSRSRGIQLRGTVTTLDAGYLIVAKPAITGGPHPTSGLHIGDFPADDPVVQCLMQISLLQCLRSEAEENAQDLKLAWEENGDILLMLRRITGFISHEFGNLLSIIQLNCDRIVSSAAAGSELTRAVGLIKETAIRGGSVSQWLRAISGDADLSHREPLDEFLKANLTLVKSLCGPRVSLSSSFAAGSANLDAPICSLLNGLVSLLRNIAGAGEANVFAEIATRMAHSACGEQEMAELCMSVRAGHGFDGIALLTCRNRSFLGQNLGRSSIAEFARSAGGTVKYETIGPNHGRFTLRLPCLSGAFDGPAWVGTTTFVRPGQQRHLIVVEDEPAALEALVELLEFDGFATTACRNAEEALAAISAWPHAILVTDVVLPTMDGLTLAQKATRANPQLNVIVMSGHVPDHGQYDPRWAFIQKPLDAGELMAAIERVGQC